MKPPNRGQVETRIIVLERGVLYCQRLDEQDVLDKAFDIIFAFDEIVALGYRENVNLAQTRTFTEMDSHEEKVYEAMRKVGRKRRRMGEGRGDERCTCVSLCTVLTIIGVI